MNQSFLRSTETLVPTEVQHQHTTQTDCVSNNYSPTQDHHYIDAFSDPIKVQINKKAAPIKVKGSLRKK